jgi:hypothetical protein
VKLRHRTPAAPRINCYWCSRSNRKPSDWELEVLAGIWRRVCTRCAKKLRKPHNVLRVNMRRVATETAAVAGKEQSRG